MPTVQANDVETYYERRGTGPAVVFVHGGWTDHRQWTPQVEALADDFEVVAAGHVSNMENSTAFTERLGRFLEEICW